ncbi:MAG: YIP1 family protein [Longimicrobiales bacterium]
MSTSAEDIQQQPPPEKASRWEDYIDVLFSPRELFERRAADRIGPPLITLAVATVVVYLLMIPVNAEAMRAGMAGNPQAEQFMEQWGMLFQVFGAIFAPVMMIAMTLWGAVLLWAAAKVTGIVVDFRRAFLIATYAAFIYLVAQIAGGLLVMITGNGFDLVRDTSFGVLRFTGAEGMDPVVVQLLRRIDLFVLWQAAIWAIGLSVIGRVSFGRAAITAAIAWLVFAVPGIIFAALGLGPGMGGGPPPPSA